MRRLLFGLLSVLVLILAAALVGPSLIDWNDYRDEIADQVREATGRDFAIAGDVDFAVLPTPRLSVHEARLANLEGAAAPDMVRLESLEVRISFLPLLTGRVVVESVALKGPVIELEVLADGRRNWEFGPPTTGPAGPAPEGAAGSASGWAEGAVQLDSLTIVEGTLIYRDSRTGRVERVEALDASIAAETLSGPARASGDLRFKGVPISFEGRTGRFAPGGKTPVQLSVDVTGAKAQLSGTLSFGAPGPRMTGKLKAEGPDLANFAAVLGAAPELPGLFAQPFSFEAAVVLSAGGFEANDIALRLADTRAAGALNVALGEVPRIDAALSFNRIDLDKWLDMEPRAGARKRRAPATQGPERTRRAKATELSLPSDIHGSVDILVDALVFRGAVIRQARLNASLAAGKATLHQASALLPGGSDVSLTGVLISADGKPRFTGRIETVADNFRGVLDWLGIDASDVPADRLHKVSLTAGIKASQETVELQNLDLRVDSSRATGGIVFALRTRPAFGANIAIDRLNLDAYLPVSPDDARGDLASSSDATDSGATSRGADGETPLAVLGAFDANVKASIGRLTYNRVRVRDFGFDGTLVGGILTVRKAHIGNLAGGKLELSGSLGGFASALEINLAFDVTAPDPARLLQFAGVALPVPPERLGSVRLSGRAAGTLRRLTLDTTLRSGTTTLAVAGEIAGLDAAPSYALEVEMRDPSFTDFVRRFDPEFKPAGRNLGDFRIQASITSDASGLTLSGVTGKLGPVSFSGSGGLELDGPRPKLTAALKLSEIIADLYLPVPKDGARAADESGAAGAGPAPEAAPSRAPAERWSREPVDLAALKLFDADVKLESVALGYRDFRVEKPRMDVSLANGVLDVRRIEGAMFDGTFALTGRIRAPQTIGGAADASLTLEVAGANLRKALFNAADVDGLDGTVNLTMELASAGRSDFDMVSALTGKAALDVKDGVIKGFNLSAVNERLKNLSTAVDFLTLIQAAMSGGSTRFSSLAGTFDIADGVVRTRDLRMIAKGGEGRAAGVVADLPRWLIDMKAEFRLTDHPAAPPFGMRLEGPLDEPRRIFDANRLQAYLVERGVGTLLRKVLPGVMGGASSRTGPAAPERQTPPPKPQPRPKPQPESPSPEDFIRGILKGLGG
ncbi:MAG: AsmA family protein [Alphaproteobacteria bacterium]